MKVFFGARVTWKEKFGDDEYIFKGKINSFGQEVVQPTHYLGASQTDPVIINVAYVGDIRSLKVGSKDWYRNAGQRRVHVELLELDGVG